MKKRVLVTGGAGFMGSAFVRLYAKKYRITVLDKMSYAADRKRLSSAAGDITFIKGDLSKKETFQRLKKGGWDALLHFAAETHVDRSLQDIKPFIESNIIATDHIVKYALLKKVKKFIHISTDEVYGDHKKGRFKEEDPLNPKNPYAATKAAADFLVQTAIKAEGLPGVIVRPANNYGPAQHREKFIPLSITQLLTGKKIPIYGKGKQIREWIYVDDCIEGVELILRKGKKGGVYNIGSYQELSNLETAKTLIRLCDKKIGQSIRFVNDRPGHDFRYGMDCRKIRRLGWRPRYQLMEGLKKTVDWYREYGAT